MRLDPSSCIRLRFGGVIKSKSASWPWLNFSVMFIRFTWSYYNWFYIWHDVTICKHAFYSQEFVDTLVTCYLVKLWLRLIRCTTTRKTQRRRCSLRTKQKQKYRGCFLGRTAQPTWILDIWASLLARTIWIGQNAGGSLLCILSKQWCVT